MVPLLFQEGPKRPGFWAVTMLQPSSRVVDPSHAMDFGWETSRAISGLPQAVKPVIVPSEVEIPLGNPNLAQRAKEDAFQDILIKLKSLVVTTCYNRNLRARMRKYASLTSKQRKWVVKSIHSMIYCESGSKIPFPMCRAIASSFAP